MSQIALFRVILTSLLLYSEHISVSRELSYIQECFWHSCCEVHVMHRMTYSSVHLCNPPEAISDGRLNPATDTNLLLAAYKGGSHLTSDICFLSYPISYKGYPLMSGLFYRIVKSCDLQIINFCSMIDVDTKCQRILCCACKYKSSSLV